MSRPDLYRAAIAARHPHLIHGLPKVKAHPDPDYPYKVWNVYAHRLVRPEDLTAEVAHLLCMTPAEVTAADAILIEAGLLR